MKYNINDQEPPESSADRWRASSVVKSRPVILFLLGARQKELGPAEPDNFSAKMLRGRVGGGITEVVGAVAADFPRLIVHLAEMIERVDVLRDLRMQHRHVNIREIGGRKSVSNSTLDADTVKRVGRTLA